MIPSNPVLNVAHGDRKRLPEKDEVVGAGNLHIGPPLIPGCCLVGDLWRDGTVAFAPDGKHRHRDCGEVDGGGFGAVQIWET